MVPIHQIGFAVHEGLEIVFMFGCKAFANSDMALNVVTAAEIAHRNTGGQSYCANGSSFDTTCQEVGRS